MYKILLFWWILLALENSSYFSLTIKKNNHLVVNSWINVIISDNISGNSLDRHFRKYIASLNTSLCLRKSSIIVLYITTSGSVNPPSIILSNSMAALVSPILHTPLIKVLVQLKSLYQYLAMKVQCLLDLWPLRQRLLMKKSARTWFLQHNTK